MLFNWSHKKPINPPITLTHTHARLRAPPPPLSSPTLSSSSVSFSLCHTADRKCTVHEVVSHGREKKPPARSDSLGEKKDRKRTEIISSGTWMSRVGFSRLGYLLKGAPSATPCDRFRPSPFTPSLFFLRRRRRSL